MTRRLFIYFRVERDNVALVVTAVRELQAAWRAAMPGLHCELLRRVESNGDAVTLIETYAHHGGVSPAWQERIERDACTALQQWLVGERHVEVFEPCA